MTGLVIAADLTSLRAAAGALHGSTGLTGGTGAAAQDGAVGHAEADAALADFQVTISRAGGIIAARAGEGAAAMSAYFVAFREAGE